MSDVIRSPGAGQLRKESRGAARHCRLRSRAPPRKQLPPRLADSGAGGAVVSGYSPLKFEISPLPLMRRAAEAGAKLALPVVQGRGKPLIMRAWAFGERSVPAYGAFASQGRKRRKCFRIS